MTLLSRLFPCTCSNHGYDVFLSALPALIAIMMIVGLLVGILWRSPQEDDEDDLHQRKWAVYIFIMSSVVFAVIAYVSYKRFVQYRTWISASFTRNKVLLVPKTRKVPKGLPYGPQFLDNCMQCKENIQAQEGARAVETPCCEQLFHHHCYEEFQRERPYGVAWDKASRGESLSDLERDILHSFKDACPFCAEELGMVTVITYVEEDDSGAADGAAGLVRGWNERPSTKALVRDASVEVELTRLGVVLEDDGEADDHEEDSEDQSGHGEDLESVGLSVLGGDDYDGYGQDDEDEEYILHLEEVKID